MTQDECFINSKTLTLTLLASNAYQLHVKREKGGNFGEQLLVKIKTAGVEQSLQRNKNYPRF